MIVSSSYWLYGYSDGYGYGCEYSSGYTVSYHIICYILWQLDQDCWNMAWKKPATITSPSKKPPEVEVNGRADGRLPIGEARPLHGTTCLGMVRWGFCTIFPWPIPIGSMVLLYMVTWIPSIYPLYVRIYTIHGSYGIVITFDISSQNITKIEELEQIEQNPC